ncbi:MAG: xanthine dehydrogenase family protein molybdopterin-binding subunit [Vicinamibacterales bacterium]|jgi:CO/xanthine dehydrogenase Mo-binding subunit|nr:xanthine dehydrogenase family protein molybdopterin-binding subunit [Vicinamibacterales bacterium]HJN46542.1 xanthine dehydrogenase family protein molybdopterin-binding subunit [Vicinamibacterales bacterium]|tara:strand:- start:478 stop:2907 length:2430 start_codon:yes stop_codon:yes gene_type:complete
MADYKLLGKDYSTPDLYAKVTGRSRYAEDHRAEGMVFVKLLVSPMPHARVRSLDTSAAEALPGVEGILTADDLPEGNAPNEAALTMEPRYEGEPIVAVAAVDEETAAAAVELIRIDLEPLPFVLDPLDSLRPGGPNARTDGNTMRGRELGEIKWTEADMAGLAPGEIPMEAEAGAEWAYGDLEAGFAEADTIVEEHSYHQSLSHQCLESRSTMAYWDGGKVYVYPSVQSTARSVGPMARFAGVEPADVVLINEFTGGGFGSKGSGYLQAQIPILLSKKIGKPVMMRVTRRDETSFGKARPGVQARIKLGMRRDGRITALDVHTIGDGGPYGRSGDHINLGSIGSLAYQPVAMRLRGTGVYTNTPPRGAQRAPGGEQSMTMLSPIIQKAAKQLGLDQVEVLKINAPEGQAQFGAAGRNGQRSNVSSAFVKEAIDKGAELFNWSERVQRGGQRNGSTVTGIGVALSTFSAGSSGVDGLFVIKPDGRMYIQSGVGPLGTGSTFDMMRPAAEGMDMPWEKCEVAWGDTSRHLPWSCSQGGSSTAHAHTRSNWAAVLDARQKLQEIAARDLGGSASDYEVGGERVYRRGNRSQGLSFARAAQRAIELGGRYDGHELPEDINGMTTASATALAGQGLMGVAKDNFEEGGRRMSFVAGFAEVEVDVETGTIRLVDYAAGCDAGTIIHPRNFGAQVFGGAIQGFSIALSQKWVYDRRWGLLVARKFYSNRPPGILDVPHEQPMRWVAADLPDPFNPLGAKGIGEAAQGAASGAVVNAIADALGQEDGDFFRTPVTRDMILTQLEQAPLGHDRLTPHV